MTRYRTLVAALAVAGLAAFLPAPADAQTVVTRSAANRGMLGILTHQAVVNGQVQAPITEIVSNSPAERGGVVVGDTIIRLNGLQPTQPVLTGIQAGDTVTLRLRRNGVERDVRLVAAPRTAEFAGVYVLPDSIRNTVAILVDRVRADLDTVNFPRLRVEQLPGDSTVIYFGGDRVMAMRTHPLTLDSARTMMLSRAGEIRMFADSMFRMTWPDSARFQRFRVFGDSAGFRFRVFGDSAGFRFRVFGDSAFQFGTWPDSAFMFSGDPAWQTWSVRPGELMRSGMVIGMRAIAGAELTELNPALGEYFGTMDGVLVLNAPDGTPAARAGLQAGDVILRANDEPIGSIDELRRIVQRARPGTAVKLQVLRRGTRFDVNLNRE